MPSRPKQPTTDTLITFPTDGQVKEWHLTSSYLESVQLAYPTMDLLAEAREALNWVSASDSRRKTAAGMKRFLVHWWGKAKDSGRFARRDVTTAPPWPPLAVSCLQGCPVGGPCMYWPKPCPQAAAPAPKIRKFRRGAAQIVMAGPVGPLHENLTEDEWNARSAELDLGPWPKGEPE